MKLSGELEKNQMKVKQNPGKKSLSNSVTPRSAKTDCSPKEKIKKSDVNANTKSIKISEPGISKRVIL